MEYVTTANSYPKTSKASKAPIAPQVLASAGLQMRAALLQYAQQVKKYQLGWIEGELNEYGDISKQEKSTQNTAGHASGNMSGPERRLLEAGAERRQQVAGSQKREMELLGHQNAKLFNYWVGLGQTLVNGGADVATAWTQCGAETAKQMHQQPGANATMLPNFVSSAMDAVTEYATATADATQRLAMQTLHAAENEGIDAKNEANANYSKAATSGKPEDQGMDARTEASAKQNKLGAQTKPEDQGHDAARADANAKQNKVGAQAKSEGRYAHEGAGH